MPLPPDPSRPPLSTAQSATAPPSKDRAAPATGHPAIPPSGDTASGPVGGVVLPTTAYDLLRRLAQEQVDARAPALVAGVVRDGAMVWSGARGTVDGEPARTEVQSRVGSITKTFTAVLVARLRDEGRLDFADPLERHIPGTPLGDRTLAQLLSHTSGVQAERDGSWWERVEGADWAALAATLGEGTLRHRAGRRYHYSNLGFALLGEVVARHRGQSWWDALNAEILQPLGLRRTTYLPEAPHLAGFAVHPWADVLLPEPAHDSGAMAPAGQLWSTVADLGRWAAFVAGDTGDVLAADTMAELREPLTVEDADTWTGGYGLGLQVIRTAGRRLVGHGGSMPGFLAEIVVDVDEGIGAVALANTTTGMRSVATDLIGILARAEPRLPQEWRPAAALPEGVLDIVGPWYWGPRPFTLRAVAETELRLAPVGEGGRGSRFRPNADGTWTGLDDYFAGETLRAVRDDAGRATHLELATFVFTREPYDSSAPVPGGVDPVGWRGVPTSPASPRPS